MSAAGVEARRSSAPSTGLRAVNFGKRTPDFAFDLGTGPARLSDLYGKPIVLNFWATWCHPCIDELAVFARLQKDYASRVSLVTITDEAPGVARRFVHDAGFAGLPITEDPEHVLFAKYSVTPLPVTLVLAPSGALLHVSIGELDWPELEGAVERALALGTTAR